MAKLTVVKPDHFPGPPAGALNERSHVRLSVTRLSSLAVVCAVGEVDAANADHLATYVTTHIEDCRQLLLDLAGLKFLAVAAFPALRWIDLECRRRGVPWIVVPSAEVSCVLRFCDPGSSLPAEPTVDIGLGALGRRRRHLRLLLRPHS
jgi:anti-anti-sigma factor